LAPSLLDKKEVSKMTKKHRILITIASVMLLAVFVFPLWQIRLQAPQYPEGLGLNIWINNVQSLHPHNIQTINDLNHYIGMKAITPNVIPELKIMPYLIILLFVMGITTSLIGKRSLLMGWLMLFVGMAGAGLVDFYKWEYNYGHNLNPNAAIKVPGMSYQPPLLGTKQLLNIRATSIPYIGALAIGLALVIGGYVFYKEKYNSPKYRVVS